MAQLVASMSGVVLGGVVEDVVSNLARGKLFTASIGSVDSLYPFGYISSLFTNKHYNIGFGAEYLCKNMSIFKQGCQKRDHSYNNVEKLGQPYIFSRKRGLINTWQR